MDTKAIWKCMVEGCNYTAPPTHKGYKQVIGHMVQHAHKGIKKEDRKYALIDEGTGEVLANKMLEALDKGLIEAEKSPSIVSTEPQKEEGKGGETTEKDDEVREIIPQISSDGIFTYNISLPADAFAMFNMAKAAGLEEDGKKPFDVWVWDCIRKRFEKDYKRRLVLAGIEEE